MIQEFEPYFASFCSQLYQPNIKKFSNFGHLPNFHDYEYTQ